MEMKQALRIYRRLYSLADGQSGHIATNGEMHTKLWMGKNLGRKVTNGLGRDYVERIRSWVLNRQGRSAASSARFALRRFAIKTVLKTEGPNIK